MNLPLAERNISVSAYGSCISYFLENPDFYSPGEYKLLNSLELPFLAECIETGRNGVRQLIYRTERFRTFADMLEQGKEEGFLAMVSGIFRSILQVEKSGFLSVRNLDAAFERIFIDPGTCAPGLIYLPLNCGLYKDHLHFEHTLRVHLAKMMLKKHFFQSPAGGHLLSDLRNGQMSLEMISAELLKREKDPETSGLKNRKKKAEILCLRSRDDPNGNRFILDKESFVIGRSKEMADGVIAGKTVGRMHCRVTRTEDRYYIEDLDSLNGTYLNHRRLVKGNPVELKENDRLRIGEMVFDVENYENRAQ